MSTRQVSQWRTVGVILLLAGGLGLCFWLLVRSPAGPTEFSTKLFDTLAWAFLLFAATAAGKSSIEHLAAGGGLRGAARALLTDAKPGDSPPAGGGAP